MNSSRAIARVSEEHTIKVSVVLTSFNHERYLREAIDGVLGQTLQDFELIIVENGSTDGSWGIVQSYQDPRITAIRLEKNIQAVAALAHGLSSARGQYVAFHASDDIWEPHKLEKQIDFMENHPANGACFTWVQFIDDEGMIYDPVEGGFYVRGLLDQPNRSRFEWLRHFFVSGNCLCFSSALVRRKAFEEADLLDKSLAQLPDLMIWIRICMSWEIHVISERLTKFRLRSNEQNESGDRRETRIRSTTEHYFVVREFLRIADPAFFLEVFPEASQYVVDGRLLPEYAFARMCLEESRPASAKLLGLELLHAIAGDPTKAAAAEEMYGFTHVDLIGATGRHDVFGAIPPEHLQRATVFADFGEGFKAAVSESKTAYFPLNGSFSIQFDLASIRRKGHGEIRALRFDPHEGYFVKCAIESVEVDGKSCICSPLNSTGRQGVFDLFLTPDPMYMLNGDFSGKSLLIRGNLRILDPYKSGELIADKERTLQTLTAQVADKQQTADLLMAQVAETERERQVLSIRVEEREHAARALTAQLSQRDEQARALAAQVADAQQVVQRIRGQLEEITGSKAWKVGLFVRRLRVLLAPPNSRRARAARMLARVILTPSRALRRNRSLKNDMALVEASGLFDEAWYLAQNQDVAAAEIGALAHYLLFGGFEGRDPSPLFSSKWYLDTYDDVKKSGANPLVHYLQHGRSEARSTMAHVAAAEATWAPAAEPTARPLPNIMSGQEFLEDIGRMRQFDKYVISISHDDYLSIIAGVQVVIGNQQKMMNEASTGYLHIYPYDNLKRLTVYDRSFLVGISLDGSPVGFMKFGDLLAALERTDPADIEDIHIHHTMGMSLIAIDRILALRGHRGTFWVHDYFSLCPSPHLLRNDESYCGAPAITSNSCTVCKYGVDRVRQTPQFVELFSHNELQVVAPSEFALDFWKSKFPFQPVTGRVSPPVVLKSVENRPARARHGELRIAFLGAPSKHKGWQTWMKVVELFSERRNYRFFHFSSRPAPAGNYEWVETTVTKQHPNAMVDALLNASIDVALLWSLTAETFSLTLHEALAAGCYILTNKESGNIQYALGRTGEQGMVLDNENDLIRLLESERLEAIIREYQKDGVPQALLTAMDSKE